MNKFCFTFLSVISILICSAQSDDYLVTFKDKSSPSNFDLSAILSPQAIEKRMQRGISLDINDYPINSEYLRKVNSICSVQQISRWLNAVSVNASLDQIDKLRNEKFIQEITLLKSNGNHKKSTFQKFETTFLNGEYGNTAPQISIHNAQFLHDSGYTGRGIKIAVFDNGFTNVDSIIGFKKAFDEHRIIPVKNYINNNENLYSRGSHGTNVLSTIAGYTKDTFIGSAPDATYFLFTTEDTDSESKKEELNWALAAEKADSLGIDIINSSLGYSEFDDASTNYTYSNMDGKTTIIAKAAEIAYSKGILVVNSAGNEGSNKWKYIISPADAAHVISVGAVDNKRNIAGFSSRGPTSDGRIKPDVCGVGAGAAVISVNGKYVYSNGTSFSSPIMAGLLACLWQVNPQYSNQKIRDLLITSCDTTMEPNNNYGYGIPNFYRAMNLIKNNAPKDSFSFYPNPFTNYIYITPNSQLQTKFSIDILNTIGMKVGSFDMDWTNTNINHGFLNLDYLERGNYYLRLNNTYQVWKIWKQ